MWTVRYFQKLVQKSVGFLLSLGCFVFARLRVYRYPRSPIVYYTPFLLRSVAPVPTTSPHQIIESSVEWDVSSLTFYMCHCDISQNILSGLKMLPCFPYLHILNGNFYFRVKGIKIHKFRKVCHCNMSHSKGRIWAGGRRVDFRNSNKPSGSVEVKSSCASDWTTGWT